LHSDQQWDATVFRLPLAVRQHFWRNQIVQAFGFIAAIFATVIFSRQAIQRRAVREVAAANARAALAEERSRIARDLHDDLGANLAEIAMISEMARESLAPGHPARGPLDKIFDRAEGNARRLGEIVWAVNPGNDTLEHFTKYLCKFAQDHLAAAGVRCRFDLPESMPGGSFTAAQRYHLLLAAKEAVHNAVRHGHPDTVTLKLAVEDGRFVVTITDNGGGCDPAAATASSRGCGNMRLRMESVGGSFQLSSAPGSGTSVTLSAPFSS
jgi:signal transduction histidine kinase